MPTDSPARQAPLIDRTALRRNRTRARASRAAADFLHRIAADETRERLGEINREFARAAVVAGWPEFWCQEFPDAEFVADAAVLDFGNCGLDLVIHAMSLHWSNDPVGQLIQCRRALKPDGMLLACLPGGETLAELRTAIMTAESELCGGVSPRIIPMGDLRSLGSLLQRAGLSLPVADRLAVQARYGSAFDLMHELRAMGETNALCGRSGHLAPRRLFDLTAEIYSSMFSLPDGRIPATFELMFLTGWAPSPKQQQPLRPGSATSRLADALSATEIRLPADRLDRTGG